MIHVYVSTLTRTGQGPGWPGIQEIWVRHQKLPCFWLVGPLRVRMQNPTANIESVESGLLCKGRLLLGSTASQEGTLTLLPPAPLDLP